MDRTIDIDALDVCDAETRRQATLDHPDALVTLGAALCARGRVAEALPLFRRSVGIGSTPGAYWLGHALLDLAPDGDPERRAEAVAALTMAAEAGDRAAGLRLASAQLAGLGGTKGDAVARLRALSEAGDADAAHLLGVCLTWGTGTSRDLEAARAVLDRARELGSPRAAEAIADLERLARDPAVLDIPAHQSASMPHGPEAPLIAAPRTVTIEITTRCNLACVMCPHGLPDGMQTKRDAPVALVDAILRAAPTLAEIHPTGVGEPMMADGFWRIVDALAGKQRPALVFHTNGVLLTERNVARLARVPVSRVNVSVDAADAATYRRVRGADMRKTTDGIARLVAALADKPPLPHHRVAMSMVLMRETIAEAEAFVRLAHDLGVRSVYFEHLTEPHIPRGDWVVRRGNFEFRYAEQSLLDEPDLADAHMLRAFDAADALGVVIEGHEVLLGTGHAVHERRPCRTGAHPPVLG